MMTSRQPTTTRPAAPAPTTDDRRRAPWPQVLWTCVAAFLVWLLLFAPTLQHNAQVSPVGTRRTVALDVLGPIAALSRGLQLSHIVSWTDEATGRTGNQPGNGSVTVIGPHHHRVTLPVKPPLLPWNAPTATATIGSSRPSVT